MAAREAVQDFLPRDRFSSIGFGNRRQELGFLLRGELERSLRLAREDGDDRAFLEGDALDDDLTPYNLSSGDFRGYLIELLKSGAR